MKRLSLALAVAALTTLAVVATVSAAGPRGQGGDQVQARGTLAAILGLTQAEVMELRQNGLTLAEIAEQRTSTRRSSSMRSSRSGRSGSTPGWPMAR